MTAARGRALVALAKHPTLVQRMAAAAKHAAVMVVVDRLGELTAVLVPGCERGRVFVTFEGDRHEVNFSACFLRNAFAA